MLLLLARAESLFEPLSPTSKAIVLGALVGMIIVVVGLVAWRKKPEE